MRTPTVRTAPMRKHLTRWLWFYRLRARHQKVSSARLLWYAVLGYALAGRWEPGLMALNTLALLGLVMFQGALNDYWDFRLAHEPNFLGALLRRGGLTPQRAVSAVVVPLGLAIPMLALAPRLGCSWQVPLLLLIGGGLSLAYSTPPLRLKTRRPWGVLVAPFLTTLMFVEAHMALTPLRPMTLGLAVLLWHFQLYAEFLHIVAMSPKSAVKYSPALALRQIPGLAVLGLTLSFLMTFAHPIFWVSVVGSTIRFRALRQGPIREAILRGRTNLLGGLLGLHEFAMYGGIGLLHVWPS